MVAAGAAESGGDVGLAVLAEDADGEVARAGHGPGQVAGADFGVVLAEGPVTDVVQGVQVGPVTVPGVQRVGGDHDVLQVEAVQQGPERGDLVALGGDLPLGQDGAAVRHRDQESDSRGLGGARAADRLAVHRDRPQRRPPRGRLPLRGGRLTGLQVGADRRVRCVAVDAFEQAADGGGVRHGPLPGERVGREAQDAHDGLRDVRDPLADGDERAGAGQHRRRCRAQQGERRVAPPPGIARVGDGGQESTQVSGFLQGERGGLGSQLLQRRGHGG
jgi:hypothetical protein